MPPKGRPRTGKTTSVPPVLNPHQVTATLQQVVQSQQILQDQITRISNLLADRPPPPAPAPAATARNITQHNTTNVVAPGGNVHTTAVGVTVRGAGEGASRGAGGASRGIGAISRGSGGSASRANLSAPAASKSRRQDRSAQQHTEDARSLINAKRGDLRDQLNQNHRRLPRADPQTGRREQFAESNPNNILAEGVQEQLRQFQEKLGNMEKKVKQGGVAQPEEYYAYRANISSPFVPAIIEYRIPHTHRQPPIDMYDGTGCPVDHIETYTRRMDLANANDALLCRAFASTLKGPARIWFNKLKPGTISSFKHLSEVFSGHFIGGHITTRSDTQLLAVKQRHGESLREYVTRFNKESLTIHDLDQKVAVAAFMAGVSHTRCATSFHKKKPADMVELMQRASKYMGAEDFLKARDWDESASEAPETPQTSKRKSVSPDRGPDKRPRVSDSPFEKAEAHSNQSSPGKEERRSPDQSDSLSVEN